QQTLHWTRTIQGARELVIVATEADQGVAGFAGFGSARAGDRRAIERLAGVGDATVGEIYTLYVQPDCQDRGIGRQLVADAFAAMARNGFRCGLLWVLRDNPSRYFYERIGGRLIAERQERMWGQVTDQVCYGWSDLTHVSATHSR
ncbi:MAG TPA: GNAT family N-acetyltransferase, partial [Dongiaceae bacterium]|nr:GNAT family N-acetyltransferase [Dongiaceae bacterium]